MKARLNLTMDRIGHMAALHLMTAIMAMHEGDWECLIVVLFMH